MIHFGPNQGIGYAMGPLLAMGKMGHLEQERAMSLTNAALAVCISGPLASGFTRFNPPSRAVFGAPTFLQWNPNRPQDPAKGLVTKKVETFGDIYFPEAVALPDLVALFDGAEFMIFGNAGRDSIRFDDREAFVPSGVMSQDSYAYRRLSVLRETGFDESGLIAADHILHAIDGDRVVREARRSICSLTLRDFGISDKIWKKLCMQNICYIGDVIQKTGDELERMGLTQIEVRDVVLDLQPYRFKIGAPVQDWKRPV